MADDTDPNTLADVVDRLALDFDPDYDPHTHSTLTAAAVGLRQLDRWRWAAVDAERQCDEAESERDEARARLAAITAAIGDPERMRLIAYHQGERGWSADEVYLLSVAACAAAASLSPTPDHPDTCPNNCANGWVQVQYDSGEWSRELTPCPDAWHDRSAT